MTLAKPVYNGNGHIVCLFVDFSTYFVIQIWIQTINFGDSTVCIVRLDMEVPGWIPCRTNLGTIFSKLFLIWLFRVVPQREFRVSGTNSTGNFLVWDRPIGEIVWHIIITRSVVGILTLPTLQKCEFKVVHRTEIGTNVPVPINLPIRAKTRESTHFLL